MASKQLRPNVCTSPHLVVVVCNLVLFIFWWKKISGIFIRKCLYAMNMALLHFINCIIYSKKKLVLFPKHFIENIRLFQEYYIFCPIFILNRNNSHNLWFKFFLSYLCKFFFLQISSCELFLWIKKFT